MKKIRSSSNSIKRRLACAYRIYYLQRGVNAIFSFHSNEIHENAERLVRWVHKQFRMRDKVAACIKRYDVSLEKIVKTFASMTGLSEDIIYLLKDVEVLSLHAKPIA